MTSVNIRLPTTNNTRPPVNKITLSFLSGDLETEFHDFYIKKSIGFVRIVLLLAVFLYMIFGILDYYNMYSAMGSIMSVRVTVSIFILACIGSTYTERGTKNLQLVMSIVVIGACLGIIYMIYDSHDIGGHSYYAGIILAIMYAHGLMRMCFIYASITTWYVIFIYIYASVFMMDTPFSIIINNTFFLIAANIMGMFTSYWIEFYMRSSYWQSRLLENKTAELESEYNRKTQELDTSRRLQLDMLPGTMPYHPEYDFAFHMATATEIGGDYYDYLVDENYSVTLAIGDATGHGARAGAMVTAIKILFLDHAQKTGPADFLQKASSTIRKIGFHKLFMSFAIIRIEADQVTFAGAGMPAALIYRASVNEIELVELKGMPLGSPAYFLYEEITVPLYSGDTLILMTDGFPELFNADKKMYGYNETVELFRETACLKPVMIIEAFKQAALKWLNDSQQNDDITLIVCRRKRS